jgi:RHS repeat-associated protein
MFDNLLRARRGVLIRRRHQHRSSCSVVCVQRSRLWALVLGCLAASPTLYAQQPEETLPGINAHSTFDANGIDNVDLFSGNLALVVPVGPELTLSPGFSWSLRAHYSSKIWTFMDEVCSDDPDQSVRYAMVNGSPAMGVGWNLDLGHVGVFGRDPQPALTTYVGPDGSRHTTEAGMTQDGSYLRITRLTDAGSQTTGYTVDFPDGTRHTFQRAYSRPQRLGFPEAGDPPQADLEYPEFTDQGFFEVPNIRYGLSSIRDKFGTTVLKVEPETGWQISAIVLNPETSAERKVTYQWGEYQTGPTGPTWPVIDSVTFFPAASNELVIDFAYQSFSDGVARHKYDQAHLYTNTACSVKSPHRAAVHFLSSVSYKSGAAVFGTYGFQYLPYDPSCASAIDGSSGCYRSRDGLLSVLTLPGGGTITYGYGASAPSTTVCGASPSRNAQIDPATRPASPENASAESFGPPDPGEVTLFDPAPYEQYRENSPGVTSRTSSPGGTTYYQRQQYLRLTQCTNGHVDLERTVRRAVVFGADGYSTNHVFRVAEWPNGGTGSEVLTRWHDTPSIAAGALPFRSVVRCYDGDGNTTGTACGYLDASGSIVAWKIRESARQQSETTWYGSNPDGSGSCTGNGTRCVTRSSSAYQAFGRYQTSSVASNLASQDGWGGRAWTTFWTWHIDSSYLLLGLATAQTTSDSGSSELPTSVTTTNVFGGTDEPKRPPYAFLFESSIIGLDPNAAAGDTVAMTLTRSFTPDLAGNAVLEEIAGSAKNQSDETRSALTGSYAVARTFATGLMTSAQWGGMSWKRFNVERGNSGLITASYDPNTNVANTFLYTEYDHDALGRLTAIRPRPATGAARTQIGYDSPTQTTIQRIDQGTAAVLGWEQYRYDGLGRLSRELRLMPDGGYATRIHQYDAAGREWFTSEWADCGLGVQPEACGAPLDGTSRSEFDPFGRPRLITLADGMTVAKSYTDTNYSPAIEFSDTYERTTTKVDGVDSVSYAKRDVLGRLIAVIEPDGAVTNYRYNVLDKLTHVSQGEQTRKFVYDAFGFLRSETNPEKGTETAPTSGKTEYTSYDSLGNVRAKLDGGVSYAYGYDAAARLKAVTAGGQPFVTNYYDGEGYSGGSYKLGQLTQRIGENPGPQPAARVVQNYEYSGAAGQLSRRTTSISALTNPDGSAFAFPEVNEAWSYTPLGHVDTYWHPRPTGNFFSVTTDYSAGLPTAVWANGFPVVSSAKYHPWGGLKEYQTGAIAGATSKTIVGADAHGMARVGGVKTQLSNGSIAFDTGVYDYDGEGNIVKMGSTLFDYDSRSRLTSAFGQTFQYNIYGSMTRKGSQTYPVSTTTNHLFDPTAPSLYQYDLRGNLWQNPSVDPVTAANVVETRSFDSLNRQTTGQLGANAAWRYLYDGASERVARVPAAGVSQGFFTFRDERNRVATEYLGANVSRDNVYLGATLVGSMGVGSNNGGLTPWEYYTSDHLGSPRLVIDVIGSARASRAYLAYGEEVGGPASSQRLRYGSMERDTETNHYYDHARNHDFAVSRFVSVDAIGGDPLAPQSWNRFTYCGNNPLNRVDPDGNAWRVPAAVSTAASIAVGFLPIAGEIQDAMIALTGFDPVTSQQVSDRDRVIAGVAVLVPLVGGAVVSKLLGGAGEIVEEAHSAARFEDLKDSYRQVMAKPSVSDVGLSRMMDELYRPGAKVGSGSTADAVRFERANPGQKVGGASHIQKSKDYVTRIETWLKKNPNASSTDRAAAESVLADLRQALR